MKKTDGIKVLATALALLVTGAAQIAKADDTEIYRVDEEQIGLESVRPKVLIVFDDSGSMRTMVTAQPPEYDPGEDYDAGIPDGRIYWSTNGEPPAANSGQWFLADNNRCGQSFDALDDEGVYVGEFQRWAANPRDWRRLQNRNSTRNSPHIECREDGREGNDDNGSVGDGYADRNVPTNAAVAANTPSNGNFFWRNSRVVTLFTSHRMNYEYANVPEDRSRIDIAIEAVSELIQANPSVDFGLLEFNYNTGTAHGGRITQRIIENMDQGDRNDLVNLVEDMEAAGATPLCESTYEAYRYLSGGNLLWGDNRNPTAEGGSGDPEDRDDRAEDPRGSGIYDSPLRVCSSVYVILMTDGNPSSDDQANDRIESMIASIPADAPQLTEPVCRNYQNDSPTTGMRKNCLPQLAEYMATQDLSPNLDGDQHAFMYTIGFQSEQVLLEDTARLGGGLYFTANTASELAAAFRGAILDILSQNTTFTSPAVAVDTFTRTESLNKVFFSMFRPTEGIDWPGNVKMLEVNTVNGERILVDKNGNSAIDPATGFIRDNASTFWSNTDGPEVTDGGVGGLLAAGDPAARILYTDTGTNGALVALTAANVEPEFFGVETDEERDLELAYARGFAVEDGVATDDPREWVMGDVLHSQPLVVNYGARTGAFSPTNPDLRILVGTNSGFIHMFGAADGLEDWAILPAFFGENTVPRRVNAPSDEHLYGVDLSPTVYVKDANNDGNVIPANDDLAYAFFGLRRGGSGYLAYDITSPDSPTTLWRISEATPGFEELGQSWSQPVIAFVPGHVDANGAPKPALIFGAGYDTALDDQDGPFSATDPASYTACDPVCGRGVFVVDAATGALLWSVTPGDTTTTNLKADGLRFPVAADVTPIDSNGDGISDRIYFSDVGGNVWRIDMAGNQLPADMTAATRNCSDADTLCGWQVNKIADLNDGTVAGDRRFFNAPDIVRTRFNGAAVDAVLIASGDRTNPNGRDVRNRFYVIRDKASTTYTTPPPGTCDPDTVDFRCSLPITEAGLRNISANPIDSDATDDEVVTAFSSTAGWYIEFLKDSTPLEGKYGEKGLARSLTIGGTVFVTTFVPRPEDGGVSVDADVCTPESGAGYLYLIDLFSGRFVSIAIAPVIPDSPSVFYGEDGSISLLLPPGTPSALVDDSDVGTLDCSGGVCRTDQVLPRSYGNYWLEEDYQ